MQQIQQQEPGQAVVGDGGHQVVHGGDQGAGGHGRIHFDFVEEQGDDSPREAGDGHGNYQGQPHASGHGNGIKRSHIFEQADIKMKEGKEE